MTRAGRPNLLLRIRRYVAGRDPNEALLRRSWQKYEQARAFRMCALGVLAYVVVTVVEQLREPEWAQQLRLAKKS